MVRVPGVYVAPNNNGIQLQYRLYAYTQGSINLCLMRLGSFSERMMLASVAMLSAFVAPLPYRLAPTRVSGIRAAAATSDIFLDEAAALRDANFSLPPDELIGLAKRFLISRGGFGADAELLSEEFQFVGPVVGPLSKNAFLSAIGSVDVQAGFPDFNPQFSMVTLKTKPQAAANALASAVSNPTHVCARATFRCGSSRWIRSRATACGTWRVAGAQTPVLSHPLHRHQRARSWSTRLRHVA